MSTDQYCEMPSTLLWRVRFDPGAEIFVGAEAVVEALEKAKKVYRKRWGAFDVSVVSIKQIGTLN